MNIFSERATSPLIHSLCYEEASDLVAILLKAGADVNRSDSHGMIPLLKLQAKAMGTVRNY